MTEKALKAISFSLQSNTTLKSISLVHNDLDGADADIIASAIRINSTLESINLGM